MANKTTTPNDPRRPQRRVVTPARPTRAPAAPPQPQRAPLSRAEREEQRRISQLATRDEQMRRRPRHTLVYDGATDAVVAANGAANDFDDEQVYDALADEDVYVDDDDAETTDDYDGEPSVDEEGDVVYGSRSFARASRASQRPAQRRVIEPQFELADDDDELDEDADQADEEDEDEEAQYGIVVPDRVDRGDEPPLPPTGMPVQLSEWINVGKYDKQFDGWYIKCYQSVSLGVMRQAESLSDEVRHAERRSRQTGKQIKPRIRVEVVQNLLCDLVADFNYVDPQRRPLPKPPYGLSLIRGDLLMATFAAATDSLSPSKPNARRSTRR